VSGIHLSPEQVKRLSLDFEGKHPKEVLRWATENLWPRVEISTAFGPEGIVIVDVAMHLDRKMKVFTIDTGFLFKETLELKQRLEEMYQIEIESLLPELTVEQQAEQHGPELYKREPDRCCAMRKTAPLKKKLPYLDGWVTGMRRSQSETRKKIHILDPHDDGTGRMLIKINPLAGWTKEEVWWYIVSHDLPYNPLHDKNYASIGCWPCTQPVLEGEDERAGRWKGFEKKECGIHTFMSGI
jgi:phosphoadenosine phosphosulfate reductase